MRKEILAPVVAVAGGAAGFALRRWELSTAFEADTGLPIAGAPATLALIALSVAMVLACVLLSWGSYPAFKGYDGAFRARGNTLYAMAGVGSSFLLLGAGGLLLWGFVRRDGRAFTWLVVAVLALVSGLCQLQTVANNYRGIGKSRYSFALLMPAYTCCMWLIAAYQVRAGDPVRLDYIYELLAIITVLLGLYFQACFAFTGGKPVLTAAACLLGIYFSITTLADSHDLASMLLYGAAVVYLLASTAVFLYNAARPEESAPAEDDTNDTEGMPHES